MPSKWEGVPINMVPIDERECEKTRREDEANRKKQAESEASPNVIAKVPNDEDDSDKENHIDESKKSPMGAITNLNTPSIFSKGLHSGMMSKSGAQRVNKKRVPDSPMGTQMVAKQDRDRPMPILQSKQDERLRKELDAARKQIELDEQDKDSLRETIEKQKKKIEELEKRPILTDEMIADLVTLRKRKEGEARRNAEYKKRHSSVE
jgi:glutaredoxin